MTQNLTTVERFKSWYNMSALSLDNTLIENLIASASQDILAYLQRPTMVKATYTEYYNGTGGYSLMLHQWPVIAVSGVNVGGNAMSAGAPPNNGFFCAPGNPYPPGAPQFLNLAGNAFTVGFSNVNVTYTAGYAVPSEAQTIPSGAPYQLKALQAYGMWAQDDGVVTAGGVTLTRTTSPNPAPGQYYVVDGLYTFAQANAGTSVLLSYSYVPSAIVNACNLLVSEQYAYRQRIGQTSQSVQGVTTLAFDNLLKTLAIDSKLQPFRRMVPF